MAYGIHTLILTAACEYVHLLSALFIRPLCGCKAMQELLAVSKHTQQVCTDTNNLTFLNKTEKGGAVSPLLVAQPLAKRAKKATTERTTANQQPLLQELHVTPAQHISCAKTIYNKHINHWCKLLAATASRQLQLAVITSGHRGDQVTM